MSSRRKETEEERAIRKAKEAAEGKSSRPKETEEERAIRKAKEAAEGKSSRPKETEEERAIRKAREAAEGKSSRPKETEEERAIRKAREAAEGKSSRPKETEEERAIRKAKEAAEGKSSRPKETEEERAIRKAKEAAEGKSSRPKETEEERAIRKAKEREREKEKERERSEKKVVRVEANIGSVHKPSASSPSAADTAEKKAEPKVQARPAPQPQKPPADDDDDDDDYGDDDFVDAAEAEALERARKAMEAENEKIRKAMAARRGESGQKGGSDGKSPSGGGRDGSPHSPTVTGTSQISVNDLNRQKYRAQYEADLARATALRRLVDLESVSVTIADIAPMSEYDLYIRSFGGSERVQTAVQAPPEADIISQEVQAERVAMRHKGAQAPEDLGLFPERQMVRGFGFGGSQQQNDDDAAAAAASSAAPAKKSKKDREKEKDADAADGGAKEKKRSKSKADDKDDGAATTTATNEAGTQAGKGGNNNNSLLSFDTAALSAFLTRVFPVVRTLLDETDACRAANATTVNKSEHAFSTAVTELKAPLAEGRPVVDTQFSKASPQNVLALYGAPRTDGAGGAGPSSSSASAAPLGKYPSIALMWNINDPLTTDRVLLSTAPLTSVCCSPTRPHLIYGGTASGSVCVWDLREPNYRHSTLPDGTTARLPSFSTEWLADNHDYPVVQVVVAGYNSSLAHRSKDEAETLTSVDAKGGCIFWMVNEDATLQGGRGAAGASGGLVSPTSASSSPKFSSPNDGASSKKGGGIADSDHGQNLFSSVRLFKGSSMNLLPANARSDAVSCIEFFPSDPTQLVAGSSEVLHLNRYGSITAPNAYKHFARWAQTSSASPVTSLHFSPLDSRVLLAAYQDGSVRLFLKDSPEPKLTIPLAPNGGIHRIRCSPALRWVTFALDTTGTFYALDHAANGQKNAPTQKALLSNMANGKCVAFDVSDEERVESRLVFGFENGLLQVHTMAPEALKADANDRNERWL